MKMIQLNTSHMFIFHLCSAFAPFDLRALELVTSTLGVELHEVVLTSVTKTESVDVLPDSQKHYT